MVVGVPLEEAAIADHLEPVGLAPDVGKPQRPRSKRKSGHHDSKQKRTIALVELAVGLRQSHLAFSEVLELDISASAAAGSCSFAKFIAKKSNIDKVLFKDVRDMGKRWAVSFIAQARHKSYKCVVAVAGFFCKGVSRCREPSRPNLGDPSSIFFEEIPRVSIP